MGFGGIIYAMSRGWRMSLVMTGFLPVMLGANYMSNKLNGKWDKKMNSKNVQIQGDVAQVFENIKTVKYLQGQEYECKRYLRKLRQLSGYLKQFKTKTSFTNAIVFFCILFNYALGFWYGSKLVADKTFNQSTGAAYDVGDVVSIFFCIYIANLNISGISGHISNFFKCRLSISRIISIVDRKPRASPGKYDCPENISSIQFRNIKFHYHRPLFQDLSATIQRGVVAIVGPSGNGKTTLLSLLMKFYQPEKGQIFIKGEKQMHSVQDITPQTLREKIGYVGQEPVLLGKTLKQVLGEHLSEEAIWNALKICCADDFVQIIGLNGQFKALSGGQKQRIAIARAVLRKPEILVLDEGTSALDRINQKKVLSNLKNKSKIKFIIMIAHRTETLQEADTIIRVSSGKCEVLRTRDFVDIFQAELIDQTNQNQNNEVKQEKESSKQQDKASKPKFHFRYLFTLLRINKALALSLVVAIICTALLGFIFPSFSYIITELCSIVTDIKYAKSASELQALRNSAASVSLLLIFISLASIPLTILKERYSVQVSQNLGLRLRQAAFLTLINKQMEEIDEAGRHSLAHLVNAHCESAKNIATVNICNFTQIISTLMCGLLIAFIHCWQITLVALFFIPFSILAGKLQNKFLNELSHNSDKVHKNTHEMVQEAVLHNRTVKSLNMQSNYLKTYAQHQSIGFKRSIRNSILSGVTLGFSQCIISFILSLIYFIGAILVRQAGVSILDLFTAIYAIMFSGVQAGCNIGFVSSLASSAFATAQYFSMVGEQNQYFRIGESGSKKDMLEQQETQSQIEHQSVLRGQGQVQFRNVCFKYKTRQQRLFDGLSFKVHPKQRLAIVGKSGSGKTTIADLVMKIYNLEEGEILLDNVNIGFYSKHQISKRFAIVSQQPALFNRSVEENIQYNTHSSLNQIKEAAKLSNAYDFVEKGSFGLVSMKQQSAISSNWQKIVGSRGSLLSGGQKQRVAVARALVRRPLILIMDQATSALDKQTEEGLLESLGKKLDITQIVIAHRMSTIKSCDRILVLRDGRVVQTGKFEQLINKKGQFYQLSQAKQEEV